MADDIDAILADLDIREYDEDIFEMSYYKLRKHFGFTSGGLHTSRLIRNLIWQDHGKLGRGELQPLHGNIRSYWYARVKPVLARGRAKKYAKKYDMMINQFVTLVVHHRLMDYAEFGFTDEGAHNRKIGSGNRHTFCIAEKTGHMPLLQELAADYDITIVALGGQPSALSSEYLLRELEQAGFTRTESVPLLTIVDYDPHGALIAESFVYQFGKLGFTAELDRIDLAHPSRMSHAQIRLNRYPLSRRKRERKKNHKWAAKTGGLSEYGYSALYGLEADAMSWSQLTDAFDEQVGPYLAVPREQIVRRRFKRELVELMKELLLVRLGVA